MKKSLLSLAFLMLAGSAAAQSKDGINNMMLQCRCVMEGGVCRVLNNPPPKPGTLVYTSKGTIPAEAYNAIRKEGGLMCAKGFDACTSAWDGDECRAFRLMFRQEPLVCIRPGEAVPAKP